jgi:hypothetical protein
VGAGPEQEAANIESKASDLKTFINFLLERDKNNQSLISQAPIPLL